MHSHPGKAMVVSLMEEGHDVRLEDCKGNVFVGGWEVVPGYDACAIDLEECGNNTFVSRHQEEEKSSTTPSASSQASS